MSQPELRKNFVSDPQVQWALARRITLHWSLYLVAVISTSSLMHVLLGLPESRVVDSLQTALEAQLPTLAVFAVLLPLFIGDTLRLSHRFAGPMVRLRHQLQALGEGRATQPLQFRSGDFWQSTAEDFNRTRERINELERLVDRSHLAAANDTIKPSNASDVFDQLAESRKS